MATRPAIGEYKTASGFRPTAGTLIGVCCVGLALCAQFAGGDALVVASLALFAGGLAHGAGDENGGLIKPFSPLHLAAYVVTGLALTALILIAPLAGLTGFLIISIWHFARSEIPAHPLCRLAIACLAVGGSALFKGDATAQVFALMLGLASVPQIFMDAVATIGAAGVAATIIGAIRAYCGSALALVSLLAIVLLDPILAVGLLFFIAHALPLQSRQLRLHGLGAVLRSAGWTTAIAAVGGGIGCWAVWMGVLDLPIAAALALGMAAPHMLTEQLER